VVRAEGRKDDSVEASVVVDGLDRSEERLKSRARTWIEARLLTVSCRRRCLLPMPTWQEAVTLDHLEAKAPGCFCLCIEA